MYADTYALSLTCFSFKLLTQSLRPLITFDQAKSEVDGIFPSFYHEKAVPSPLTQLQVGMIL